MQGGGGKIHRPISGVVPLRVSLSISTRNPTIGVPRSFSGALLDWSGVIRTADEQWLEVGGIDITSETGLVCLPGWCEPLNLYNPVNWLQQVIVIIIDIREHGVGCITVKSIPHCHRPFDGWRRYCCGRLQSRFPIRNRSKSQNLHHWSDSPSGSHCCDKYYPPPVIA